MLLFIRRLAGSRVWAHCPKKSQLFSLACSIGIAPLASSFFCWGSGAGRGGAGAGGGSGLGLVTPDDPHILDADAGSRGVLGLPLDPAKSRDSAAHYAVLVSMLDLCNGSDPRWFWHATRLGCSWDGSELSRPPPPSFIMPPQSDAAALPYMGSASKHKHVQPKAPC
jgi:hypothetical protein